MGIGPHVRRLFGRYERPVSEAWRRVFVDLNAFAREIEQRVESPRRVLEIGCGDGAVIERLAARYPHARLTGIDVCREPGRLFRGDETRVRFISSSAAQLCETEAQSYDLVVIADVLHHVPERERTELLCSAARLVATEGVLVLKDWTREPSAIYLAGYCADRFITGDRVHYMNEHELRALAESVFGAGAISGEFRVPPWSCNLALVIACNRPRIAAEGLRQ